MKISGFMAGVVLGIWGVCVPVGAEGKTPTVMDQVQVETETKLGLSAQQRDRLKELKQKFGEEQKNLANQMKLKGDALREQLDAENPDRKKVDALAAEITKLNGQAMASRIDQVFAIRALLTADQYQKLRGFLKEKREQKKGLMNAAVPPVSEKGKKKGKQK